MSDPLKNGDHGKPAGLRGGFFSLDFAAALAAFVWAFILASFLAVEATLRLFSKVSLDPNLHQRLVDLEPAMEEAATWCFLPVLALCLASWIQKRYFSVESLKHSTNRAGKNRAARNRAAKNWDNKAHRAGLRAGLRDERARLSVSPGIAVALCLMVLIAIVPLLPKSLFSVQPGYGELAQRMFHMVSEPASLTVLLTVYAAGLVSRSRCELALLAAPLALAFWLAHSVDIHLENAVLSLAPAALVLTVTSAIATFAGRPPPALILPAGFGLVVLASLLLVSGSLTPLDVASYFAMIAIAAGLAVQLLSSRGNIARGLYNAAMETAGVFISLALVGLTSVLIYNFGLAKFADEAIQATAQLAVFNQYALQLVIAVISIAGLSFLITPMMALAVLAPVFLPFFAATGIASVIWLPVAILAALAGLYLRLAADSAGLRNDDNSDMKTGFVQDSALVITLACLGLLLIFSPWLSNLSLYLIHFIYE